ncbi:hypothetical protein HOLleu_00961 [Holothuria leucospilota]|uniref:Farnesoic acid O-methyl transferase domain-containing protein n=1 Tax=Holothuria leucospilota TaxID=206669 RepID=A0A9Q1CPC0_HOLLE|nr:hypothetical protein HOLleu_00961 [Holothuria leucospilota]
MQYLNQHELRHFRIDFDSNGEISVARNYTAVSFMNWTDTADPLIVQFIGYSTVNNPDLISTTTLLPPLMQTTYTSEETNLSNKGKPLLWATNIIFAVLIVTTLVISLVIKRTK